LDVGECHLRSVVCVGGGWGRDVRKVEVVVEVVGRKCVGPSTVCVWGGGVMGLVPRKTGGRWA
jgi:hypothetical protein